MVLQIYMDVINVVLAIQEFLFKDKLFITYKIVLMFLFVTAIQNTKDLAH